MPPSLFESEYPSITSCRRFHVSSRREYAASFQIRRHMSALFWSVSIDSKSGTGWIRATSTPASSASQMKERTSSGDVAPLMMSDSAQGVQCVARLGRLVSIALKRSDRVGVDMRVLPDVQRLEMKTERVCLPEKRIQKPRDSIAFVGSEAFAHDVQIVRELLGILVGSRVISLRKRQPQTESQAA